MRRVPSFLGTPIELAAARFAKTLGAEGVWATLPVGARKDIVSMHVALQDRSQWCWAAVSQALLDHYQQGRQAQCQVATTYYGRNCCAIGDQTNQPELVSSVLGRLGLLAGPVIVGRPDRQRIVDEIDAQRPIGVLLQGDGISHVVTICGYTHSIDDRFCVLLGDPAFGEPTRAAFFEPFTYQGLNWSNSYLTRRP